MKAEKSLTRIQKFYRISSLAYVHRPAQQLGWKWEEIVNSCTCSTMQSWIYAMVQPGEETRGGGVRRGDRDGVPGWIVKKNEGNKHITTRWCWGYDGILFLYVSYKSM